MLHCPQVRIISVGPSANSRQTYVVSFTDLLLFDHADAQRQFDDINIAPLIGALQKVPEDYMGLDYTGLGVFSNTGQVAGLGTNTPPNNIAYSVLTRTVDEADPLISVHDPDTYIALESLYLGCSVDAGAAAVGTDCTVLMSATDKDGLAQSDSVTYAESTQQMLYSFPANFGQIKSIGFTTSAGDRETAVATSIDTIKYTLCKILRTLFIKVY